MIAIAPRSADLTAVTAAMQSAAEIAAIVTSSGITQIRPSSQAGVSSRHPRG